MIIIMTMDNNSIVIIILITIVTIIVISTITILIVFTIIILVYIHIYIYHIDHHISTIIYPWYFRKLEKTMTTSAHSSLELARAKGIAMFRLQAKEYNSK